MKIVKMRRTEDYATGKEVFYTRYEGGNVAICEGTYGLTDEEYKFMQNAHINRYTSKYGEEVTYTM